MAVSVPRLTIVWGLLVLILTCQAEDLWNVMIKKKINKKKNIHQSDFNQDIPAWLQNKARAAESCFSSSFVSQILQDRGLKAAPSKFSGFRSWLQPKTASFEHPDFAFLLLGVKINVSSLGTHILLH
ncbi:uncharacterized protein C5orf46 homolog isoform X1 [Balaenoptera musculus]|uniref:Uncharacterized protein C5orf46 homolog isoform X1 n=1 Tax=Balaenoptera musculus TaxID=9771 RepID=A0A8B8X305_BALMU|nr:uncharacterized protein C5orf46 homolog isoform X1 [Balaenoptera musculus]